MAVDYPEDERTTDALSGIVAMTAKQLAKRADVTLAVAKRVLKRMVARGDAEQRDSHYKAGSNLDWIICQEDLPTWDVACRIAPDSSAKGYAVEIYEQKPIEPPEIDSKLLTNAVVPKARKRTETVYTAPKRLFNTSSRDRND